MVAVEYEQRVKVKGTSVVAPRQEPKQDNACPAYLEGVSAKGVRQQREKEGVGQRHVTERKVNKRTSGCSPKPVHKEAERRSAKCRVQGSRMERCREVDVTNPQKRRCEAKGGEGENGRILEHRASRRGPKLTDVGVRPQEVFRAPPPAGGGERGDDGGKVA